MSAHHRDIVTLEKFAISLAEKLPPGVAKVFSSQIHDAITYEEMSEIVSALLKERSRLAGALTPKKGKKPRISIPKLYKRCPKCGSPWCERDPQPWRKAFCDYSCYESQRIRKQQLRRLNKEVNKKEVEAKVKEFCG